MDNSYEDIVYATPGKFQGEIKDCLTCGLAIDDKSASLIYCSGCDDISRVKKSASHNGLAKKPGNLYSTPTTAVSGEFSGYGTFTANKCRHSNRDAFFWEVEDLLVEDGSKKKKKRKVVFHGSSGNEAVTYNIDLLIDLDNITSSRIISSQNIKYSGRNADLFSEISSFVSSPDVIVIPWKDMSPPSLRFPFWKYIIEKIESFSNENMDVLVTCIGGHGRTGTFLTAILMEKYRCTAASAIKFVRKEYCRRAIETESQLGYLKTFQKYLERTYGKDQICEVHNAEEDKK
jgi:protein-tyrosine phosphatase